MRRAALLSGYLAGLLALDHYASYHEQLALGALTWAVLAGLVLGLRPFQRAMVSAVASQALFFQRNSRNRAPRAATG